MKRKIPNLFIVGAAKAGTNSLWFLLKQHPEIFMTESELVKEPGYFSNLIGISNEAKYLELFAHASQEKYVGEASTSYLTDPASAKRIYQFNPDAKIIIMLRNPIHRAYSLYNWMVQEGYEYSPTFEAALAQEEKRKNKNIPNLIFETQYFYNYMYISSGLYSTQIARYVNLFGRKNVFIGLFEEFIDDTKSLLMRIFDWLEIEKKSLKLDKQKNPSNKVVNSYLPFILRKFIQGFSLIYKPKSKEERDFLLNLVKLDEKPKPLKNETYKKLYRLYQDEYRKLEEDFRLNLDVWRKADQLIYQQNQ